MDSITFDSLRGGSYAPLNYNVTYLTSGEESLGSGSLSGTTWQAITANNGGVPVNNLTGTVEFRIYGSNASGNERWYHDNIIVNGQVVFPGDANSDGMVNAADAAVLAENWLTQGNATWGMGDFNEDNNVDDLDATMLATNWGYGTASGNASVPEPGSITLLLCGLLAGLICWRRGR